MDSNPRQSPSSGQGRPWGRIGLIVLVTFLVFLPSLQYDFINWDEKPLLLNNPLIRSISIENTVRIFKTVILKIYSPLTLLFFSAEYHFFGYDPLIYHLNNLALHLGVVVLIFFFGRRCGLSVTGASVAALIFGVHPLRVESVVWVAERKDVLFAFFYMLSLLSYWEYLSTGKGKEYVLGIVWGLLSMLAKPMAYSLPVVFLICDWFYGRKFELKVLVDKIPHVLYIGLISLITLEANTHTISYSLGQCILMWAWALTFYIVKFIWPANLTPLYQLPQPTSLTNPVYLSSILILIVLVLLFIRFRRNRWVVMAYLFYLVSIFFIVLRVVWGFENRTLVADRFMYIPSLGLCFLLGHLYEKLMSDWTEKHVSLRRGWHISLTLTLMLLCTNTFMISLHWRDSLALWTHVIRENPKQFIAYNNRGNAYFYRKNFQSAFEDYNKAIAVAPHYARPYNNRGSVYAIWRQHEPALADFNRAIFINANYAKAYHNRGTLLKQMGRGDLAEADFAKARELAGRQEESYGDSLLYE